MKYLAIPFLTLLLVGCNTNPKQNETSLTHSCSSSSAKLDTVFISGSLMLAANDQIKGKQALKDQVSSIAQQLIDSKQWTEDDKNQFHTLQPQLEPYKNLESEWQSVFNQYKADMAQYKQFKQKQDYISACLSANAGLEKFKESSQLKVGLDQIILDNIVLIQLAKSAN